MLCFRKLSLLYHYLENFVQSIQERHKRGGSTSSFYFGDAAGQNLYAVSVYPDRAAFIPGRQVPSTLLRTFIQANRALLEDARNAVGSRTAPGMTARVTAPSSA